VRAYIINLTAAPERWASVSDAFAGTQFILERVEGVDGYALELPIPEYAEARYRWLHGRPTSPGHVGCYLSHVRAMKAFLATCEPYALIGEDDLTLGNDFERVVQAALRASASWNLLRLTGLGSGGAAPVARLHGDYSLCVNFSRLKGTGAYLIDRRAALALSREMLPMWLPIDHALDREWAHGLHAACVWPFPASQVETGFRSSIQRGRSLKLSALFRWLGAYPYQALNEVTRFLVRSTRYLSLRLARPTSVPACARPAAVTPDLRRAVSSSPEKVIAKGNVTANFRTSKILWQKPVG
jgi:glycosyl transferase family 25